VMEGTDSDMWVLRLEGGRYLARFWLLKDGAYRDSKTVRVFESESDAMKMMGNATRESGKRWQPRKPLDEPSIVGCWI